MNKNEVLKILGFSEDANPQKCELEERFEEKQNSLINNLDEAQSEEFGEELLKVMDAHTLLIKQFIVVPSKPFYYADLDNQVDYVNLYCSLVTATCYEDINYLEQVFSKFKSSKNGRFGDYINKPSLGETPILSVNVQSNANTLLRNIVECNKSLSQKEHMMYVSHIGQATPLFFAILCGNIDVITLFLKSGADPNTEVDKLSLLSIRRSTSCSTIKKMAPLSLAVVLQNVEVVELLLKKGANPNIEISEFFLRNDKIKKLLIEYGRYDKSSVFCQLALAALASYVAFEAYSSCDASFSCYAGVAAIALIGVLFVAKSIHDVFYTQTKWPSSDLDEASVQEQGTAKGHA